MQEPHVLDELKAIAIKIETHYPKFDATTPPISEQEKNRRATVSDIQFRLAEIYGVIQHEIEDNGLDITHREAQQKLSSRLKSIFSLFTALTLAIKTKLNIGNQYKFFDADFIQSIDGIIFHCYTLQHLLEGKTANRKERETFNAGLKREMSYTYYRTGFTRTLLPGSVSGQIAAMTACTAKEAAVHSAMIKNMRERLDTTFKAPTFQERTFFAHESGLTLKDVQAKEQQEIKPLAVLAANVLLAHKNHFFKDLKTLDLACRKRFPALDIDYRGKLIREAEKVLTTVSFVPTEQEKIFFVELANALTHAEGPYNGLHKTIALQKAHFKKAFLGSAAQHIITPLHNQLIALMKQYTEEKKTYEKHFSL